MTIEMLARDPFELVAERDERVERIKRALLEMSEPERRVLVEHELGGLTLARVAQAMRISAEEAESLLELARRRLRAIPGV